MTLTPGIIIALLVCSASMSGSEDWQQLIDKGMALQRQGEYVLARDVFQQSLQLADVPNAQPKKLAASLNSLALTSDELNLMGDAVPLYRRALSVLESSVGKEDGDYAMVLGNLAGNYLRRGQIAKSEALTREALAIDERVLAHDDRRLAMVRSCLAELLLERKALAEVEPLLMRSIAVFENDPPEHQADLAMAQNNLGVLRAFQKRYPDAIRMGEEAIRKMEVDWGPDHPALVQALNNLAHYYYLSGRGDDAANTLRRSVKIAELRLGSRHPTYAAVLMNYAGILKKTGHKREGKTFEAQSRAILNDASLRTGAGQTIDVSAYRSK